MAMRSGVQFSGIEQFAKALRDLSPSKQRGVKVKILKKAAEPIAARMSELAPIEPGAPDLKDSITISGIRSIQDPDFAEAIPLDEDAAAVAIGPSKKAFYGWFQEFGVGPHGDHPGNAPHPFARPAWDARKDQALRSIADDIWAYIRDASGRSTTGRNL